MNDHLESPSATFAAGDTSPEQPLADAAAPAPAFQGILKRDGRREAFAAAKITRALLKAGRATGEFGEDTARLLCDDGETGKIVVSAIPTIAPYLMPGLLESFHGRHPRAAGFTRSDTVRWDQRSPSPYPVCHGDG